MSITTILFDADHTLYTPQSDEAYKAKFAYLAEETGKKKDSIRRAWEQRMEDNMQTRNPDEWERKQMITETLADVGAPTDDEIVEEAYTLFWETVVDNTDPEEDVGRMLRTLHSAGYNLVIATDEFPEPLRMKLGTVLRDTDVDAFFDTIVTCRDVEKQKPSRRYYELVLDELNVPADQCVMVGDSWVRDLKPAQDLGMTTILVGDADPTENPDFEIDTVTQVEAVVDQVNA